MKPQFSPAYLESLFTPGRYENLVEISSFLSGSASFAPEREDYGLELPLFAFVESLAWFAQSVRSGAWTYFEATPTKRQARMREALESLAPAGFAAHYALGMSSWREEVAMRQLDNWLEQHDSENNKWLWHHLETHRAQWLRAVA
jgi:hypothetical protein